MSYNGNIPLITDPTLQSYNQIRANFQAINQAFATNHAGLTADPSISGMHGPVILQPQNSDPATSATQIALYNKLVSSIPSLFFRPNSSQTPIQLSYPSIKADSTNTQYSFVAGPFLIYGGKISSPTVNQTITLSPGTNLIYVGLMATNVSLQSVVPATLAATGISGNSFNITFNLSYQGFLDCYYFAIGN